MYTEKEMSVRVRKLWRKARFTNGIDILVTHAPAEGYGDMEDLPHRGFECFNKFLMKYKPLYMLHGHVHKSYGHEFKRLRSHPSGTVIVNAYESYILDLPDIAYPEFAQTGSGLYDFYCKTVRRFRLLDGIEF